MDVVLFQAGGLLQQMLQNMQYMGFFLYLFPFLLALAIVYGVLSWSLSDRLPKSARGLVSIIIAFFVMLYSSWNIWVVTFFAEFFGASLVVLTGILVLAIMLGLAGFKIEKLFEGRSKWIFVLAIIVIVIVIFYGAGAGWLIPVPAWSSSSELWTVVIFIIILVLAMWWLSTDSGKAEAAPPAAGAGGKP